jgi:arginase
MQAIGVIGAPSSAGAYAPGQELAPQRLREAKLLSRLEQHGAAVHDRGDLSSHRWSPDRPSRRAQNIEGVISTVESVGTAVAPCIEAGERPSYWAAIARSGSGRSPRSTNRGSSIAG